MSTRSLLPDRHARTLWARVFWTGSGRCEDGGSARDALSGRKAFILPGNQQKVFIGTPIAISRRSSIHSDINLLRGFVGGGVRPPPPHPPRSLRFLSLCI